MRALVPRCTAPRTPRLRSPRCTRVAGAAVKYVSRATCRLGQVLDGDRDADRPRRVRCQQGVESFRAKRRCRTSWPSNVQAHCRCAMLHRLPHIRWPPITLRCVAPQLQRNVSAKDLAHEKSERVWLCEHLGAKYTKVPTEFDTELDMVAM